MEHCKSDGMVEIRTFEERIRNGEALFQKERWAEAEKTFRHILAAYPDHPQALNDLACLLWKTGRSGETLQVLRRALKVAPEDRDVIWNCGQILIGLGFFEDALLLYQGFLKENPDSSEFKEILEDIRGRTGADGQSAEEVGVDDQAGLFAKGSLSRDHTRKEGKSSPPIRLAFASGKSLFPIGEGGGEISTHELLSEMSHWGGGPAAIGVIDLRNISILNATLVKLNCNLEVKTGESEIVSYSGRKLLYPSELVCTYNINYPVSLTNNDYFLDFVEGLLSKGGSDYLLFQAEKSPQLFQIALRSGVFPIFYVRNGLDIRYFQDPQALPLILANSKFYRDRIHKEYGAHCELLYPAVNLDRYVISGNSHDYITMINPVVVKGIVPFLQLAQALPNKKFLVVEGWGTPTEILNYIDRVPNVRYMGKQLDMRFVYDKTHVLVVPSQLEEAFGRVIVEAQSSGIPVMASEIGGIPEALGKGGLLVKDFKNPAAWLEALKELEGRYEELSVLARINAERFSVENTFNRFLDIIHSLFPQ